MHYRQESATIMGRERGREKGIEEAPSSSSSLSRGMVLWVGWPSFPSLPGLFLCFHLISLVLLWSVFLLFLFDDDIPRVHPPIITAPIAKPKSWPILMTHHHPPPTMETLQHCHMNFSV